MSELCEKGRKVYICLVAGVFPLFFTDYYYNIQKSKSCFFIAVTIAAAVFWCVTAFMGQRGNRKAETADICFLSLGSGAGILGPVPLRDGILYGKRREMGGSPAVCVYVPVLSAGIKELLRPILLFPYILYHRGSDRSGRDSALCGRGFLGVSGTRS